MENKVKYTRTEYRSEYLQSEDWKRLRNQILATAPDCQCCGKSANDVHHMVYRNLVDVKVTDLLPVCRTCHDYIHDAIRDGWISQEPKDIEQIRKTTLNILNDTDYEVYAKWLSEKHILSEEEQKKITKAQGYVLQKISGLVKRNVWYDKLSHMKFTGRQIVQIRKIINISEWRRSNGYDKHRSGKTHHKVNKTRPLLWF
jgi:hypothetical protein